MGLPSTQDVDRTLGRIRPFLELDGGNVELVRVTDEGIVEVRLTGSCLAPRSSESRTSALGGPSHLL